MNYTICKVCCKALCKCAEVRDEFEARIVQDRAAMNEILQCADLSPKVRASIHAIAEAKERLWVRMREIHMELGVLGGVKRN